MLLNNHSNITAYPWCDGHFTSIVLVRCRGQEPGFKSPEESFAHIYTLD